RGFGFTGQAGVLYRGFDRLQLGLSYRGRMNSRVEGKGTLVGLTSDHATSSLRFPDVVSGGFARRPTDPWMFSRDLHLQLWHCVIEFGRDYSHPFLKVAGDTVINADNVVSVRLGTSFSIDEQTRVSFGYSYLPRAVPITHIIPALPDYRANTFAFGLMRSF